MVASPLCVCIPAVHVQGYDKVGYLKKKDSHSVTGWKKRWFTLRGKNLAFYRGVCAHSSNSERHCHNSSKQ